MIILDFGFIKEFLVDGEGLGVDGEIREIELFLDGFYGFSKSDCASYILSGDMGGANGGETIPIFMLLIRSGRFAYSGISHMLGHVRSLLGSTAVRFVHVDKEMSEVKSIMQIYGPSKVRLCLWHLFKSVNCRCRSTHPVRGARFDLQTFINQLKQYELHIHDFTKTDRISFPLTGPHIESLQCLMRYHLKTNPNLYQSTENAPINIHKIITADLMAWVEHYNIALPVVRYLWSEWYCPQMYLLWVPTGFDHSHYATNNRYV